MLNILTKNIALNNPTPKRYSLIDINNKGAKKRKSTKSFPAIINFLADLSYFNLFVTNYNCFLINTTNLINYSFFCIQMFSKE